MTHPKREGENSMTVTAINKEGGSEGEMRFVSTGVFTSDAEILKIFLKEADVRRCNGAARPVRSGFAVCRCHFPENCPPPAG